jgi:hypothetical protein
MLSVERSVEWVAGETEVHGGNLPQCRLVRHKFQITLPRIEPGLNPATNHLSYGTGYSRFVSCGREATTQLESLERAKSVTNSVIVNLWWCLYQDHISWGDWRVKWKLFRRKCSHDLGYYPSICLKQKHERPQSGYVMSSQDLNEALPNHKSEALVLHQPGRCHVWNTRR